MADDGKRSDVVWSVPFVAASRREGGREFEGGGDFCVGFRGRLADFHVKLLFLACLNVEVPR